VGNLATILSHANASDDFPRTVFSACRIGCYYPDSCRFLGVEMAGTKEDMEGYVGDQIEELLMSFHASLGDENSPELDSAAVASRVRAPEFITISGERYTVVQTPEAFVRDAAVNQRVAIRFRDAEMRVLFRAIISVAKSAGVEPESILEPSKWFNDEAGNVMDLDFVGRAWSALTEGRTLLTVSDADSAIPPSSDGCYYFFSRKP
jgi:hypothetical protein